MSAADTTPPISEILKATDGASGTVPAPCPESIKAMLDAMRAAHATRLPPAKRYEVKNPLPMPAGDLYLDLGGLGSGYLTGWSAGYQGDDGEGFPTTVFCATIYLKGPGAGAGEKLGRIVARLLRTGGEDFQEMCDCYSEELENMGKQLFDEEGWMQEPHWECSGDLLYIESVFIEPRYRGYGISLLAINQLTAQIPATGQLIVVIAPCPINLRAGAPGSDPDPFRKEDRTKEEHRAGVKALCNLYEHIGFRRWTSQSEEKRHLLGLEYWGLWTGYLQPDIKEVVPHLF